MQRVGGRGGVGGGLDFYRHRLQAAEAGEGKEDEQEGEQVVHQRPRQQHEDALPGRLVVEGGGVGGVGVLPREGAKPAQREQADGENFSVLFGARKQLGAEPDGKFFDFEMQQLSRGVVAELVHGDHGEQDEQRKQHRADGTQHVRRGE